MAQIRELREKTTITLPVALKREAEHLAVETRRDLSDLIAEGLRLVLARHKKGR
jgi:hypothetical protein